MTTIPVIDLARTGANIVNLRKAAGLSVHDLQVAFGFNSPQAIYKWQNGTALPTKGNFFMLSLPLGRAFGRKSASFPGLRGHRCSW